MDSAQWSDGYLDAPMMPDSVNVTRCANCHAIYWVEDAPCVGDIPETRYENREVLVKRKWWFGHRKDIDREVIVSPLRQLPEMVHLDTPGLLEALGRLPLNPGENREEYIRMRIRWAYNHRFRSEPNALPTAEEEAENKMNLEKLLSLVDPEGDQGKFKSAGLLLELGRFGDARAIVSGIAEERLFRFRDSYMQAADQALSQVFLLRDDRYSRR